MCSSSIKRSPIFSVCGSRQRPQIRANDRVPPPPVSSQLKVIPVSHLRSRLRAAAVLLSCSGQHRALTLRASHTLPAPRALCRVFAAFAALETCHPHQATFLKRAHHERIAVRPQPPLSFLQAERPMLLQCCAEGLRIARQRLQPGPLPLRRITGIQKTDLHRPPSCDPRHEAQYPPISRRAIRTRKRQSFSTCCLSLSKPSLTNSVILPQRRQAM